MKINVNAKVFFFFTTTASLAGQFWLISCRVTDWFWLISFNDNGSFFFITAFLVVNSTPLHLTRLWCIFLKKDFCYLVLIQKKATDKNLRSVLILVG